MKTFNSTSSLDHPDPIFHLPLIVKRCAGDEFAFKYQFHVAKWKFQPLKRLTLEG